MNTRIWAEDPGRRSGTARMLARCQTAQTSQQARQEQPTFAASLQSADSRPSSTYTNSLRRRLLFCLHYLPHHLDCLPPIATWSPCAFTGSLGKGHVWRSKSGTLFEHHRESSRLELHFWQHGQETRGRWRGGTDRQDVRLPRRYCYFLYVEGCIWRYES